MPHTPDISQGTRFDGSWSAVRRGLACLVIAAYVLATGFYFLRHVLGDSGFHPQSSYFFTWDMFPDYRTTSGRRVVLAETREGRFLRLYPGPLERYRWGSDSHLTRFDATRPGSTIDPRWKQAVENTYDRLDHTGRFAADPMVRVYWLEERWPCKFNLEPSLYRHVYDRPHPRRTYWRLVAIQQKDASGPAGTFFGEDRE